MGNTALTTATQAAPEVEWMWQASLLSLEGSYVVIKKLFEVVDVHSNRILSASGNMVMQNTNDFLASLLIGKNIVTQMDEMCDVLKKRFLALAQKAVIVALRDAQNHYLMAYPAARENPTGI